MLNNDDTKIIKDEEIIEVEEHDKISGLYYIDNIKIDTLNIISESDKLVWQPLTNSSNSRAVQHYGFKYNYITNKITEKCSELPIFLNKFKELLTDICLQLGIIDTNYKFNQCIVNNYYSGQGISAHIDVKSYGNVIGCFTIGSGTIMKFSKKENSEDIELYVKPNSLYIMSGDSRYKWCHSMPSKKFDIVNNIRIQRERRISLTFRNVPM